MAARRHVLKPFRPMWWLRGSHAQTLAGVYWPNPLPDHSATSFHVALPDGDTVVVHDDCPENWQPTGKVTILIHGLGGCHRSPLLVRLTEKLTQRAVRVFRWDMRGCGAGIGLAVRPYHAGCSKDLHCVIQSIQARCPQSAMSLFGVSLSGNIVLKYLGEEPDRVPEQIEQAICVNPPIDLAASVGTLDRGFNRLYDRYFVGALNRQLTDRLKQNPDWPMPPVVKSPRRLFEFDDWYTAPMSGFRDARTYYAECSASQFIPLIRVPTTIITSQNDPMIPIEIFDEKNVRYPQNVQLIVTADGGHVGYIASLGVDPDIYWLDWRVVELIT